MAKLRFLPDQPHEVPLVGRIVEPDELVEVDDATYLAHDWPETVWAPVEVPHDDVGPKAAKAPRKTAAIASDTTDSE